MRVLDRELLCSASDLVGFAACGHLTQLELAAARGELTRPTRDDPLLDVLVRRGEEHEAGVLARYDPAAVVRISDDHATRAGLAGAARETIDAMHAGARVIYQATFLDAGWVGHADFVERVDGRASDLGPWSYEVADAKLARSVKAGAIVQLCDYSARVEHIQGVAPERIHVDTGDGVRHTLRLADFTAYYRRLRSEFEATARSAAVATYPDPVAHCRVCRWSEVCRERRRADDHLSLVAGIRGDQTRRLVDAGIDTRRALADAPPDAGPAGIGAAVYERLRHQAELQVRGEGEGTTTPIFELLAPPVLPEPSPGDLFLDLEGDPYALDDHHHAGLEYLFGIVEVADGGPSYHEFWAHDRSEERAAFEAAVDFIAERRRRHPDLHVYHYASYEVTAFKRLMGAHGTREDEIDDFLRSHVFVDLFRVVRDALRLSTESYSLKDVERLYFDPREGAVLDAGGSIVAYEEYLADADPARLREIARYNEDDCVSLVGLREWLEALGPAVRPVWEEPEPPPPDEHAELAARLAEAGATEALLGHLLEWHRREAKPAWWQWFDRRERSSPEELVNDSECIGGLELVEEVGPDKQSICYRFRFDAQDHKFSAGSDAVDPATARSWTITEIGDEWLVAKRSKRFADEAFPSALIPGPPFGTDAQRAALAQVAAWVCEHGIDADGPYRAARDLLLRHPPRGAFAGPGFDVLALDHGCLGVQGPPGSGKTYTGARMIVALLAAGRRVGITATTHSAIGNLLTEVMAAAEQEGVAVRALQKADEARACGARGVECTDSSKDVEAAVAAGEVDVAAGTAWLWARQGMRESVDVLVVDEAGQMSLADVVAVSTAARNLVLLGDPQQLAQPSQGTHPDGAGASALEHLLGEHETIPPDLGRFLDTTWRMHPSVCRFVSEIAYEGRLESEPHLAQQSVDGEAGLRWAPVEHVGDRVRSRGEADAVARIVRDLVGSASIDEQGDEHELAVDDLIVVAPYNAHVAELRSRLPAGVPVGTVDKFQGREGTVAIYSMASSSVDDAPRGMNFLYDLHRFNVAISRAKARAYVVASPELLGVVCHTPTQLRLANALCRYVELAG